MIVLIFVTGEDAVNPLANHREHRVVRISTRAVERGSELLGQTNLLIELPHDKQTGVTRKSAWRVFDIDFVLWTNFETFRPHTL